jgi:hypothetical protein
MIAVIFMNYVISIALLFIDKASVASSKNLYLFSLASSDIALPPCCMSLPAPYTVLQPASVPNVPAKNSAANSGKRMVLIILNLLS